MKSKIKRKTLALVLAISMILMSLPISGIAVAGENNTAPLTNPFTPETIIALPDGTTTKSQSYRIPSMVTLADGTIVAAADIRWNTTYDGGGLDTLVACSTDGGKTWSYNVANYLGDNGNQYNPQSTTFIDPNLLVAADGQTVYMLVDLYAYGVSMNGLWGVYSQPAADTGFDTNGNLKLSDDDHNNYNYYLKDGKIYDSSNNVVEGYEIDAYFNITYTTQNGEIKKSNLFFAESPFKVARTQYLYLTKSTDGGATWSEPNLLDVRAKAKVATTEKALLVSPGNSITTSSGIMVFPVYSYNGSAVSQQMAFIYSTDGGETWLRSDNFTGGATFSSEAAVVELENGNLRFFYRSDNNVLSYADFNLASGNWSAEVQTEVPTNSDTQLSAITYSKTMDGKQVILISCPTGPNGEGSNDNNGSARINGKIHVFVMEEDGTMTLKNTVNMFETLATEKLPNAKGDFFTEGQGFFSYSSMTERADGSIAILYENSQSGWGAGEGYYFTITAKTYDQFELLGATAFEDGVREKVVLKSGVSTVTLYRDPRAYMEDVITVDASELEDVYYIRDRYFDVATGTLLYQLACCVGSSWPADGDGYLYVPANLVEQTDDGIAYPIVDFTNAAPYNQTAAAPSPISSTFGARTISTFGATDAATNGLALSKSVVENPDGTYTITLEAYTTGQVTVSQVTKPMDVVLVIDQSGSMAKCIVCGDTVSSNSTHEDVHYTVANRPNNYSGEYYIKDGSEYDRVYGCSTCNGWWTESHSGWFGFHSKSGDLVPDGTQFYTRTESEVSCTRRYDALIEALNEFVGAVQAKTVGPNGEVIDHRIAIVGFSSSGFSNTELLTGVTVSDANKKNDSNAQYYPDNKAYNGVQYGSITNDQYSAALQDMSTDAGKASVGKAIESLTAHGGTQTYDGMDMAYQILQNDTKKDADRDKVVILFTDGATDSTESQVLNRAYNIKQDFDATIYTVGIFDGANGSLDSAGNDINDSNTLMHLVSSNYPDARYANNRLNKGDLNPALIGDNSYYLSAGNADALKEIFKSISSSVGNSSSELDATAVVKDIVSPQFVAPAGTSAVAVYQIPYTPGAGSEWGTREQLNSSQVVTIENNTVNVTGFDFKHNFVAETGRDENDLNKTGDFYGRKLQIVFTVSVDPYFLGGSNVPTNGAESGVYDGDGNCVGNFNQPVFAIPLREISTVVQDKNVYLTNTVDLTTLLNLYVQGDQPGENLHITVDGINNAYVDLEYTIKLNDNTVAVYEIPAGKKWSEGTWKKNQGELLRNYLATDDTPFTVTCVMTDAANPFDLDPSSTTATDIATVYVYKPTVTFQDATKIPNSESVDYAKDNFVSVVWLHGTTEATPSTVEGTAPTLTYTYSTPSGCIDSNGLVITYNEFYVNVTKVLSTGNKGDIDITNYVTFAHKDCPCGFVASNGEFMIHLTQVYTSLVIQKAGWEAIDPNQSFIFNVVEVDANGNPIDNTTVTVTVHENGSVTIEGLLVNRSYKVTEDTNWSWRYVFSGWEFKSGGSVVSSGDKNGAIVTLGSEGNIITFENERSVIWWLDGDSWCNNIFKNPNE